MEKQCRCIYCGSDITGESDIIPDALTNARITNRNVCITEHNNKFSDLFEYDVIKELAVITNELNIKSHKSKTYAHYEMRIEIEGTNYRTKISSEKELFSEGKVLVSDDKKHKLSSMDKIKQIAKDKGQILEIDINNITMQKTVEINPSIYFSEKMYRMISKIAYEWYCAQNNVVGYYSDFERIVNYITKGEGECPVTILKDKELYKYNDAMASLGSHSLFAFIDIKNRVNVVVSFFGIVMYRVVVADSAPDFCQYNFLYLELRNDSSKEEIKYHSYEEADNSFMETMLSPKFQNTKIQGINVLHCTQMLDINPALYVYVLNIINGFRESNEEVTEADSEILDILYHNIQNILQASPLNKRMIKRFVKEYFGEGHRPVELNPNSKDKKLTVLFYILFVIGKNNIQINDDKSFQKLVKEIFNVKSGSEFSIEDDLENKLVQEMLETENYSDYFDKGAAIISRWKEQ